MPVSLMAAPAIAQEPPPAPAKDSQAINPGDEADAALARAKTSNKRIEIESYRSETATYYANPDGKTLQAGLSATPVRVKKDGEWRTVDPTLIEATGTLQPKASLGNLRLSLGGDATAIRYTDAAGETAISAPSPLPRPVIKDNTATYPSAYGPGIDMVVTVTPEGFRQDAVIKQRPIKDLQLRLPMQLPKGLALGYGQDKSPGILDAKGKEVADRSGAPMLDSAALADPDKGRIGRAKGEVVGDTLVFTAGSAFLNDPATVYPVTVTTAFDEWEGTGIAGDTHVSNVLPNGAENATLPWLLAGKSHSGTRTHRTYIMFHISGTPLEGGTVHNADLRLHNQDSHTCSDEDSPGIVLQRVTSPWSTSTISWSNQPPTVFDGRVANKGAYSATRCPEGEGELYYSIEQIVQAWMSGTPDYGVQLSSVIEADVTQNWRYYRSHEYGGYDTYPFTPRGPVLFIQYTPVPKTTRGILMPYQDAQPTLAEIDAATSSGTAPQTPPEVTGEQATAMRENSDGYYMEDTSYGFGVPEEVTEQEWLDGMDATYLPGSDREHNPNPDTTPPAVTSTTPANAATDVLPNSAITATFSEPVSNVQAAVKTSLGTSIAGTLAMDAAGTTMTFTPQQPLSANTAHTVELSGARDASGNTMAPYSWAFTTDAAPKGHWKFDEGSGRTAADSSGNENDATLAESTKWIEGKLGTALSNVTTPFSKTPTSVVDERTTRRRALASQEAVRQGKPVEVGAETSETAITYALPDGSYRTEIAAGPVRVRKNDAWVPIDTTLLEVDGALRPKAPAGGAVVEISTGGTTPYARVTHRSGETMALSWPTPLPRPKLEGNKAVFENAAGPGMDLVITALPAGVRQTIRLRERPKQPVDLRFAFAGTSTLTEGKEGRLTLTDGRKRSATAPPPLMWDASAKGLLPNAKTAKVPAKVVTKGGRTELVLKLDNGFLSEEDTVYPVQVDSTLIQPIINDVGLWSLDTAGQPAYPGGATMMAGTQTGNEKHRTYLRFDTVGLPGQTVTDAKLSLLNIDSSACGAAVGAGIQVQRVTGTWDANNLYWANKPTATREGAQLNTAGYSTGCADGHKRLEWNVTSMAQDWAAGAANHGLVLQSPTENNTANWRVLTSSENTDFAEPTPTLTITTSGPSSSPSVAGPVITPAQQVNGVTVTNSLTPQLAATVADTIGGTLTAEFEVEHDPAASQGTGQIWTGSSAAVASGSQAAVSIPTGKLSDNLKIRWRVRAVNSTAATTSPWSSWALATVDVADTTISSMAQTTDPVLRTDQSFSIAAWLRWNTTGSGYSIVEQKGSNTTPFKLGSDPQNGLVFTLTQADQSGSTSQGALSGIQPPVNEWFHLVGVYDSSANKVTLYLNGTEIKNAPVSFPGWSATGPMHLGANMGGNLDEVSAYQKALSPAQVSLLYGSASATPPSAATKTTSKRSDAAVAAAKKFQYAHMSTADCKRIRPPARGPAVAYTGSFTLCYSFLVGEVDTTGPPMAEREEGRWTAQMVIVVHSYVGHMIGKANAHRARPSDVPIGRSLNSRQIRMQVQMGPVTATGSYQDDWQDRWMRVFSGASGCTADANDGAHKTVEEWAQGNIHEIVLDRTSDDNSPDPHKASSCSLSPNVRYTTHWFWDRKDLARAQTFRCDSSTLFTFYASGCVLASLRPVLIFDENSSSEDMIARHVWTALYDSGLTWPKVGSGPAKKIPGAFIPHAPSCHGLCLRRSTSEGVHDANAGVAIPQCRRIRNYVKPDSCDEYPFATTLQGAGQTTTGYNYSVAIVHENQNCSQGGTISQWYQRNRILDLDAYWVDVIRRGDNRPYSGAPGTVARDPASTPINLATCTFDGVS
ncbi:DNRLRE domain-containing protein [Nonomuraea sp. NPDC059023]|uniref:DNRLRE domain-containing protein n=2 Tax=unclassified Nonomuraea TaxID=2593643 RepID=UPI0036AF1AA9